METETNIQEDASAMGIVLPEGMDKICAEKEQVDDHSETQSMEEVIIKHTNSEEKMTTESSTKWTYDMGELEKIPESHSIENLSIKDGGNIMPEEAKDIKEATDVELQKSETESDYLLKGVPEDESTSTLPKLAIDQAETAEIGFEKETLEEEESTEIDNNQCCRPQNELEQTIKAFEAIDLPQTMGKDAAENEHTDHQSEATSIENVITKHSYSEGTLTMESSTKPSYDEEEPEKIPESHCLDNPEIKDCGKLMPEKAIHIKEATEVELQKSETESVPEDKALSTLPITASVPVEAIVKSIEEEIHKKEESAVTEAEEGQRPEYDFEKTKVPEALDLHEATENTSKENEKKDENQSELQSVETFVGMHPNFEGPETTDISPRNNTEELEKDPASHTRNKLEMKDGGNILQEEKEMELREEAKDMQLLKSTIESIPEDEAQSMLPASAIVKGETVEETLVEQTLKEEESAAIDKDNRCPPENEIEQTANIAESISQPKTMVKARAEYEENDDHQYETSSMENVITKHISAEGKIAIENSTKSSHNVDKLEKIPESHSVDNSEIKDGDKITPEDATDIKGANDVELQKSESESEPKDKALSTLATTASVGVGTVEKSIKEEIDTEAESAVKETIEGQQPENDFAEIKKLPEAIDLYKVTHHTFTENEEKAESQPEELNLENTVIEHPNLEEETTEINPATYTEQHEKVPASHTGEKLDIKDYGKFIHEEAKEMDDAIDMQLLKTSTESVPDEARTTLPTSAIVKGEMVQEILQQQPIREEEPAATDNDNSCNPENEPDNTANVVEAIDQPKIMANIGAENEEQANHQSEPPSMGSVVTKHINAEANVTWESSTNDNEEDKKEKNTESHPIEDLGMKDGSKITPEEETDVKKSTDAELQKSEAESVPEDKSLSTLPSTASAGDETVEKGIQEETHTEVESAVTDTKEGKIPENEVEQKKKVPEAFDLHKTTSHTSTENEPKTELQSEVQNPETTVIKHPNLEAETKEIYPTKDSEEYQKVPASHSREKIENEDDVKFIQEEAEDMEEATDMLSLETATESVHDDKTRTTLPTSARVEGELVEEILQQQTLKEEESEEIDNDNSCSPENELDNSANIVKEIDQPKTMANVGAENEEHANHQSETSSMEDVVTKKINAEGKVTSESSTNSCYDVDKLEQIPQSRSIENSGVKDASKIIPEEATDVEKSSDAELQKYKAESVPEDKSLSTLPSTVSARDRTVGESIQEETHTEVESAVKDTKEGKIPENEVDEKKKVPEEFDLHKITSHSSAENEPKAELQSEVHSLEMTGIKHPILEAETTEINPTEDSEEYLKVRASHTREKLENEDDGKFIQEQAKETEEATDMQLLETARGSVPNDEAETTLPTSGIVKGEMVEEILQQQTLGEEESEVDNDKICTPENELEKAAKVVEAIDQPETTVKVGAENEHADHQSEASNMESVIAKHINTDGKVTSESNTCSRHDVDELEKIPESHLVENSGIRNGNKIMPEEAIDVKESIAVDLQKSDAESVLEDKALSTLPSTASVGVESVEESLQEDIHAQAESTVTNIKEGQIPENDFKEKNKVPEAFDEYDMTHHTSIENEQKTEPLAEAQNMETTIIKHPNLDRETTEIDQTICTEEHEQDLPSHTREKLEIKDDEKFIQEEAKEMEDVSDTQLLKTPTESVPEDEGWSTLPTSVIVKGEMVEEILQHKAFKEEESTAIDNNKSYTPEHELQITATLVEAIDQPETITSFGAENEVHADHQSNASSTESMTTKHINAEGKVTSESNTNSSYDVDELEKIPESNSIENTEINAGAPEDKSISTLPNTASVRVEAVEESIQEEIHTQVESATTDTKEGQMPENDFEEKDKVPEAFDLHKVICHTSSDNEQKAETESEAQKLETTVTKHPKLEGETTEINPTNGPKEHEKVPASHSGEKLEIEDDAEFIHEEAKEMEEATDMHLRKTATASVPNDEDRSTLSTSAIVKGETVEEILQQQTLQEEESAAIGNDKSCRPGNELEEKNNAVEAFDQPETMVKVGAKNGEHADHHLEASHVVSVTANHKNAKGMLTSESSTKSSYDVNEPENIPVSPLIENSLIQDGVHGDKALPTLPTTESVGVETVDKGFQEKIYMEAESTVTDTTDAQRQENDFEEKKKAPEAFDQHEVSHQSSIENEQKVELLAKGQNLEICVIKHPNLEGKTADINPVSDTEKHEKDPGSYTGEKLEIKDGGKFINEEAKEMEEAADMQLLKTTTESVLEDEVQSTLPTSTIVKGEKIEEIFQEQTLEEEESAAVDNNDSCRPENELDHPANVFEATDQPKTVAKDGAENVDHHYEQSTMENMITKHISSEGMVTTENSTKSSYDVEELEKVPDLDSVGNAEIKDAGKITLEEAIDIKEATDVELQKPEIESVPEEKSISTLSKVSSVRVETVEEIIREELQNEAEPAVTDVKEGQRIENDFEENMKVLEAFGPQKATGNTYAENEKKAEPQSEAQRMETTVIKHPYLKGLETAEKSPSIYIDELEKVPTSHTGENLDIKDGGKIIQEEATEIQSLKTETQSVHKDETPSTLASVEGETVEQSFQDQTPKEEESTAKDNKNNSRPENKLEQTTKVLESISQPETTNMVSAENEENADYQSEAPSMENVITKQNAGVPEDKALSTLPTTASVTIEAIEKSTQEEIHKKEESAVTDTEEGQRPEYDFEKNKVPQTFHIHKGRGNTCVENEKKAEPQSEAQTIQTMVIKYSNLEGQVATEINPDIDTEVLEKVPVSQEGEKLEIKDGRKIIKEEEKEMEEATSMQSLKTAIQSLPEDESSSTLPTWTFVKGETFEKNFSEQTLKEEESTEIENKSFRTENQLEQTTKVLEASDLAKLMSKVSAENEEHTDHQSEVPSTENVITEYTNSEGMLTTESSRKSSYVEELENIPESHSFENSEIKDSGKTMPEEEIYIQEATDVKLQKSETESVPKDKALSTLPTKASGEAETVEKSIQQEIRKETESAETDTKEGQIPENDFKENMEVLKAFDLQKATRNTCTENEKKAEPQSEAQSVETMPIKHQNLGLETTNINPSNNTEELEKVPASHTTQKLEIKDAGEDEANTQLPKSTTESVLEDESTSTLATLPIVKGETFEKSYQEQKHQEEETTMIENNKSCRKKNELEQMTEAVEHALKKALDLPEIMGKDSAENEEHAGHQSEAPSMENVIIKHTKSKEMVTVESSTKSNYDVVELEKISEPHPFKKLEIEDGGKIMPEEAVDIKEGRDLELHKSETESVPEDKAISTVPNIASVGVETFKKGVQEEIHKETESAVTDTQKGQSPENEFEENTNVLEAFDLHKVTGNTCVENAKKAEAQSEVQSRDTMVIKHPNLEGLETTKRNPSNDTTELEGKHKVSEPGGGSELVSVDVTKECSNKDIPMLGDLPMLSDQNPKNNNSDISKISASDHCKLDSEKEENLLIEASGCTATSTHKNSETIEGQENSETTFKDSLIGFAGERAPTELETEDSSHEHQTTDDTPAEKIVKEADTNEKLELAPESIAIEQSDKKNSFDSSMYTADGTSMYDANGEKVRNSLESIVAGKLVAKLDPDDQSDMRESTKMDESELAAEKIPGPPYPGKKLESYFDSEAHEQTKEKSNNIQDQISESDHHIQQEFQCENQTKPEPQMEAEHDFSVPLNAKKNPVASLITKEVHDGVDKGDASKNIETQTIGSDKSLSEVQILFPGEETVNQVKDHSIKNFKATDSQEQRAIADLSFENDPIRKEATSKDTDEATEQPATGKQETQEAETTQVGTEKEYEGEDDFEKISPSSSSTVMIKDSQHSDVKVSHKKSHGILSGVGSKVKHSISKVKKAITGKSSHPKTPSPK